MAKDKFWVGAVPTLDDYQQAIGDIMIDGKTKEGPWAIMTPESHAKHGVGLGTGRGQKYRRQVNGKWVKIEG